MTTPCHLQTSQFTQGRIHDLLEENDVLNLLNNP